MSRSQATTKSLGSIPIFAVISLALFLSLDYSLWDMIKVISLVWYKGEQAFVEKFLHELTHDIRHAAGFPCH